MSSYEIYLAVGVFVPLITFAFLAFFGHRLGKPLSGWAAVGGAFISLVLATITLIGWWGEVQSGTTAEMTANAARFHWADLGSIPATVGVKLDSLTVIMYFMVAFVSFWIFVFSIGYMSGHSDEIDGQCEYHRFFCFMSLFLFSMLGLVVASSLLFLFIFWELVGLCSYFLIGFYFDKKFASDAGIKAFVTNRVGDFGFLIGLMMVFFFLGTLDLDQAAVTFEKAAHLAGAAPVHDYSAFATQWLADNPELVGVVNEHAVTAAGLFTSPFTIFGAGLATIMGIGLFCGAIGKSAQFPLHVWLPDAMAGPTPVSALIHAATMVAAGVYLVARIFRLLTPEAQMFVAIIGCITLTITALIAIVQTDIKKVLAYSTLSQLGYMIFGLGVGAWIAALFHLMTHAFFKAMLFLGSGQVIEGCHHEQDIRNMGGLRKKMPFTCWTFFVGVLAIAGAGIPAVHFGLGGYFSKDEILAVAYERAYNWSGEGKRQEARGKREEATGNSTEMPAARAMLVSAAEHGHNHAAGGEHGHGHAAGHDGGHGDSPKLGIAAMVPKLPKWLFWLPIIIAYVTPFYMMRLWWLTFMGKPRNEEVYRHAHEIKLMYIPLVVLSVGTVFCSYLVFRPMLADAAPMAADAAVIVSIDGEAHHHSAQALSLTHEAGKDPHTALIGIVGFAYIVGMGLAWLIYRNGFEVSTKIRSLPVIRYVHTALEKKLYFDHLYEGFLVPAIQYVIAGICNLFDTYVIDLIANLSAKVTERFAAFSGRVLDARGIDGVVNGIADSAIDLGNAVRRPQTGLIRNYVLLAAGGAVVVVMGVLLVVW
ncbi:MAG: NADH-quinone oxidoreductase subunit L [Phycisphaerae bacterium]|nr:NADH-quinone oxidoreductase subunit L [Phycisphaerae bacterium]